jgi:hypothetical protein
VTANAGADGFINGISGLRGLGDNMPDTGNSETSDADIADTPASGLDAGGSYKTGSEAGESNNSISDTNDSGSTPPKALEHDAAEMLTGAAVDDDADGSADADLDLAALRAHECRIPVDFLNEGYGISSRAAAGELADSDEDDEDSPVAVDCDRFVRLSGAGRSDSSSSDAIDPATVGSDVGGSETPGASRVAHEYSTRRTRVDYESSCSGASLSPELADSDYHVEDSLGIARGDEVGTSSDAGSPDSSGSDGSSSEASNGSAQTPIELSPDDESE